jgi:hypothetical protein
LLLLLSGLNGRADAEDVKPPPPAGDTPGLLAGPSMYETGRVGPMHLSDPGTRIEQTADPAMPGEQSVKRAAVDAQSGAPLPPTGSINAGILEREIDAQFSDLRGCRLEVARRTQVAPKEIKAGRLILRWTILATGLVGETEVVAAEPIDIQVMDCVKRQMSFWSFTRPRGGTVRLARHFDFR